jgi:two-component system, OmpR family, phosphate regulon sensor histidine kinase PhoR
MSRSAIITIIILMTVALIGVGFIQFFWIKISADSRNRNFDERIRLSINHVKDRLVEDLRYSKEFLRYKAAVESLPTEQNKYIVEQFQNELLENLEVSKLDTYLKQEFDAQGINIDYDYGVYSNKTQSFLILNGNYVAEIGNTEQKSNMQSDPGMKETQYEIPLYEIHAQEEPGYLKLYFPKRGGFVWKDILPIMLLSILFTGLILICFSYTIYIILRQKKTNEIKTDFINNMTHEFKTPIATISLATDSISNPSIISNESKVRRFLGIIKEENKRMLTQVEKVLQMAQIDKQQVSLKISEFDLHDLLKQAVDHAELKISERGGNIELFLNATKSEIEADQNHIANIIANLLDNAEKYTESVPHIKVESFDAKNGIRFTISDNGIGMSKDSLKHIYEKFFRVHTGNRHDIKGFGLGLSYVKAMVDAHGGKIMVKSEIGKGTNFTILLPYKHQKKL